MPRRASSGSRQRAFGEAALMPASLVSSPSRPDGLKTMISTR